MEKKFVKMSKEDMDKIYSELVEEFKENDKAVKEELIKKDRKELIEDYQNFIIKNKCKTRGDKNGK